MWTMQGVTLGKRAGTSISRLGFVREDGLIAMPPKNKKKFTSWAKKMKLEKGQIDAYVKQA